MNQKAKRWTARIVLTAVTALFIGWIFSNSLKDAVQSSSESSFVRELVQNFFDALFPGIEIKVSEHAVRKAAHFSEYALLGFLLFFTCAAYTENKRLFFIPVPICAVVPFFDEGLQFFAEGRYPALADVGIDFCGAVFGLLCAWAVLSVFRAIVRACQRRKKEDKE